MHTRNPLPFECAVTIHYSHSADTDAYTITLKEKKTDVLEKNVIIEG